ncbi:ADM-like [Salarias fasciatus]|uniref:ADM-like n=1 Tax=Salarias fasciatus TaxID=181472 RepID=UPI001176B744|nr:ADM-like [Salarias fasciatus]
MRLSVQTFLCCCVFATVLLRGSSEEPGGLRRRLRGRLQSHMKRDALRGLETTRDQSSDQNEGRQEESLSDPTSAVPHMRPKRSTPPKASGCIFITCVYHDLVHRLHDLSNKQDKDKVPEKKLGCNGYGRRRRSARTQL